jgi:hypothetical protein
LNALLDALPHVVPPLLVIHGDSFLAGSLAGFGSALSHRETAIAVRFDDDGVAEPTKDLVSIGADERILAFGRRIPGAMTANSFGCYALGPGLPEIMREVGMLGIPDVDMIPVFRDHLRAGGVIRAVRWEGVHHNLNREADVLDASRVTLERWPELRYPRAERGTWVRGGEKQDLAGGEVTGPAWIAEDAMIAGAVIGPHAALGAGASAAGARVANALVYPGARVDGDAVEGRMAG